MWRGIIIFQLCAFLFAIDLPAYLPRCNFIKSVKDIPEFEKCIRDRANEVNEIVKNGFPELGILPIDNFVIPEVHLEQNGRVASFNVTLTNITAENLWKYNATESSLEITEPDYIWSLNLFFDELKIHGGYKLSGNILNQVILREGNFQANISNSNMKGKLWTHLKKKKGLEYALTYKSDFKATLGKIDADLGALFGIETLDKAAAAFLEQSANEILKVLSPDIEKVIQQLVFDVINRFAEMIPFRNIFP